MQKTEMTLIQSHYYIPVRVLEISLDRPLAALSAYDARSDSSYTRAIALVRLHEYPLGVVEFEFGERGLDAAACAERIWQSLHTQINRHLNEDGLATITELSPEGLTSSHTPRCIEERERFLADPDLPFITVVVPTRDRPEQIAKGLPTFVAQKYPRFEILVVDNAPVSSATEEFVRKSYGHGDLVRYIREDRPGLSLARNAGMVAGRGSIQVFVDDDMLVDPHWLYQIARGFSLADDVKSVTGHVLPQELDTPAQFWFEENRGSCWFDPQHSVSNWPERKIFTQEQRHVHLYRIGLLGTGAHLAFDADFLRSIGGFDPALGGSGPSHCGQDIAALFQVIMRGHKVVFDPAVLGFHAHRRELSGLRKQFYNYGIGLTAYLTKNVLEFPQVLVDLSTRVPFDLAKVLLTNRSRVHKRTEHFPRDLMLTQARGMLYGPLAYLQSLWVERDSRRSFASTAHRR